MNFGTLYIKGVTLIENVLIFLVLLGVKEKTCGVDLNHVKIERLAILFIF